MAATTIALYSHDSVGLGHARRNRALAYTLAEHLPALTGTPVRGLLIAGHPDAGRDPLPEGWDWLVLPGLTRRGDGYAPRRLGTDAAALRDLRSATIDAALAALRPDLLIIDRHPFGIDGELLPVLRHQHARGGRAVLGLREVLDAPRVAVAEWDRLGGAEHVARHLDAVWVYGDELVYDPRRTGELPRPLAELATATGYLAHGRPAARPSAPGRAPVAPVPPYVLTVLGGGSDGGELARLAVAAELPAGHRHLLITGPQMAPEEIAGLQEIADERTTVARSAPDVPELIAGASAVVCMGGYNTVAELLVTDTPALVVPRSRRRQEQPRRALALAAVGALETRQITDIAADDITAWWRRAVTGRTVRDGLDLDGLVVVPPLAAALLRAAAPTPAEVSIHAV
ncbi:glycosyl transferase [Brachybacterium sp. P6-10-X1]|uniref:glycosyltransferase family protein n=1 Tax=Brachybacterium sp. P6-10-X1 TaxID=1903186 RepID=UPI0009719EE9|nr:glycosyltransferase [Brachybacterium sp. P6-10-X1]APX33703.1 glycosyl transferase [Brachybacterium sp. P6-10-X1]